MDSCTVHCRFSSPDPPPWTQTIEAFVVSYVGPSTKENGSGVWSTLEIWLRLNFSSWGPSPSPGSWMSCIYWWKSWMAASLSLGGLWAVFVLLRKLILYSFLNLVNRPWEYLKVWSGWEQSKICFARASNHFDTLSSQFTKLTVKLLLHLRKPGMPIKTHSPIRNKKQTRL